MSRRFRRLATGDGVDAHEIDRLIAHANTGKTERGKFLTLRKITKALHSQASV